MRVLSIHINLLHIFTDALIIKPVNLNKTTYFNHCYHRGGRENRGMTSRVPSCHELSHDVGVAVCVCHEHFTVSTDV